MKAPWIAAPPSTSTDWTPRAASSGQRRAPERRARPRDRPMRRRRRSRSQARCAPRGAAARRPASTTRSGCWPAVRPAQPHGQPRIVGAHRPGAHQHRVVRGAQLVRGAARGGSGDPDRAPGGARPPVGAMKPSSVAADLQRDQRPPLAHPDGDRRGSAARHSSSRQPTSTRTPARRSRGDAPRRRRAGSDRDSRPRRARRRRGQDRRRAGPRAPGVAAGLERHVQRRAARPRPPSCAQRVDLGVGLAGAQVKALGQRSARRAPSPRRPPGSGGSCPAPLGQRQRPPHEALVGGGERRRGASGPRVGVTPSLPAPSRLDQAA